MKVLNKLLRTVLVSATLHKNALTIMIHELIIHLLLTEQCLISSAQALL